MSDTAVEFIEIKESLLTTSQFLNEHLADYESYSGVTFRNQLLAIQSKLTTLFSLSKSKPRSSNKFADIAADLLRLAIDIETAETDIQRTYNIGQLAGASSMYLNEVNSIIAKID